MDLKCLRKSTKKRLFNDYWSIENDYKTKYKPSKVRKREFRIWQ